LKPISEKWNEDALAVSGPTREDLAHDGADPSVASAEFVTWVDEMVEHFHAKPVFAAYPLGFDWQFAYHYMLVYAGRSPFGHSAHFDMKTAFAVLARIGLRKATKRNMPPALLAKPHSQRARRREGAGRPSNDLLGWGRRRAVVWSRQTVSVI
jgi:hypothetical protein